MSSNCNFLFLVRTKDMTQASFKRAVDSLRAVPRTTMDAYEPEDPDEPLSLMGQYPYFEIGGIPFWGFYTSTDGYSPEDFGLPPGMDALWLSAQSGFLSDIDEKDMAFEVMVRVFMAMDAVYAVMASEFAFEEIRRARDLHKVFGEIHLFSSELVQAVGRSRLERLQQHGDFGGSMWLRTIVGDDSMSGVMRSETLDVLREIWSRTPLLSTEEERPEAPGPERPYRTFNESSPDPFIVLFVPNARHGPENLARFLGSLPVVTERQSGKYGGSSLPDDDALVREYLDGNYVKFTLTIPIDDAGARGLETRVGLQVLSATGKGPAFGPQFDRESCTAVLLWIQSPRDQDAAFYTSVQAVLFAYARAFGPVFGFGEVAGGTALDPVALAKRPPASRLWPILLYDTKALPGALDANVRSFWAENLLRWGMREVDDRFVILFHYDPHRTHITEDVSRRVLGDDLGLVEGALPPMRPTRRPARRGREVAGK